MTTQYLLDDSLKTIVAHVESGEKFESSVLIPKVSLKGQNEFQSLGSGITYLRRYSLSCMLGLITDKDADAAGQPPHTKVEPKKLDYTKQTELLNGCKTLEELKKSFTGLTSSEQSHLVSIKDKLKLTLK